MRWCRSQKPAKSTASAFPVPAGCHPAVLTLTRQSEICSERLAEFRLHGPLPARHREWKTKTAKANFLTPKSLAGNDTPAGQTDGFQLTTIRSQGQFNTAVRLAASRPIRSASWHDWRTAVCICAPSLRRVSCSGNKQPRLFVFAEAPLYFTERTIPCRCSHKAGLYSNLQSTAFSMTRH
jgi:hypothetical protein